MWIHWPFFPKTWTKGHWPLDGLWPHVCWGHMCDSTQRIIVSKSHDNTSMYVDTVINFANYHIHTYTYYIHTTYILRTVVHTTYILRTYYGHTTYRMSDHIVSYWTQFRRDKNVTNQPFCVPNLKNVTLWCFHNLLASLMRIFVQLRKCNIATWEAASWQ